MENEERVERQKLSQHLQDVIEKTILMTIDHKYDTFSTVLAIKQALVEYCNISIKKELDWGERNENA